MAIEEFLKEVTNGAVSVAVSRGSKHLTPAHIKAHGGYHAALELLRLRLASRVSRLTFSFVRSPVMMEPTLDFCRGVVQHAPDLTEEGADGAPSRPKKERKPREKKPAAKKETTKKKRKVKSESEEDDEDDEDEEDEWDTADETEEEDDDDDARGANGAKPAKATKTAKTAKTTTNEVKTEQKRDVEDIKVDLGDLGDLAVDGLVGEDDLQAVGGVDAAAAEEEDYDDF